MKSPSLILICYIGQCGTSTVKTKTIRWLPEYESYVTNIDPYIYTGRKDTIKQLTIMLASSRNVLFPGHNYLLTIGADDPWRLGDN